jgi:hypothetical protein
MSLQSQEASAAIFLEVAGLTKCEFISESTASRPHKRVIFRKNYAAPSCRSFVIGYSWVVAFSMSIVFYATLRFVGNFLKFMLCMLQLPEHSILVVFHVILSVWYEQAIWAAQ